MPRMKEMLRGCIAARTTLRLRYSHVHRLCHLLLGRDSSSVQQQQRRNWKGGLKASLTGRLRRRPVCLTDDSVGSTDMRRFLVLPFYI